MAICSLSPVVFDAYGRWSGNAGTDSDTGKPIIYDPCAFYAHNEYEIGIQKVLPYETQFLTERCLVDLDRVIFRRIIR
jgi:Fructosamine kinase